MQAKKIFIKTNQHGRLVSFPELPPNTRMEVIFLIPEDRNRNIRKKRRIPSSAIAGKGRIIGDIVSPVVSPEDWEALQ